MAYIYNSMTTLPYTINNRTIRYIDIRDDLADLQNADLHNWLVFVIEENIKNAILGSFADLCIDKNVFYMCAAGKAGSAVDDLFDYKMVERELDGGKLPSWHRSDDDVLMTTWHDDLEEGFWFATTTAYYENIDISTILVANLTGDDYLPVISTLANKYAAGYIPPD